MKELLEKYRGVILVFLVLVVMSNMLNARVKEINAYNSNTEIAYYEK